MKTCLKRIWCGCIGPRLTVAYGIFATALFVIIPGSNACGALPNGAPERGNYNNTYRSETLRDIANSLRFERVSARGGMPYSTVTGGMLQDYRGFLWFGTREGLLRYDGYGFKTVWQSPLSRDGINDSRIRCLLETVKENETQLWIGTLGNGLFCFDREKGEFTPYKMELNEPGHLLTNFIGCLYNDHAGNLWIGTWNAGLAYLNQETGTFVNHIASFPSYSPQLLSIADSLSANHDALASILSAGDNLDTVQTFQLSKETPVLIVAEGEFLGGNGFDYARITGNGFDWTMTDEKSRHAGGDYKNRLAIDIRVLPPGEYTLHYYSDESHANNSWNTIPPERPEWWGAQVIALSSEAEKQIRQNMDEYTAPSIGSNSILAIHESPDEPGVLWLGTDNGLTRFNTRSARGDSRQFIHFTTRPDTPGGLNNRRINSICESRIDGSTILWLGTAGGGLNRFNKLSGTFTHYKIDPLDMEGYAYNDVPVVCEDRDGILWVGSDGGGLNIFDRETERFLPFKNDPGNIYSISSNNVQSLYEDRTGILWIGTWGGGVNKLDRYSTPFLHFGNDPKNSNSLSHNRILSLFEDRDGIIWIGTDGGGLDRFDPVNNQFTHYRSEPGNSGSLSSNYIISLYQDRRGYLWIGTWREGLNRFDPRTGKVERFRHDDNDASSIRGNLIFDTWEDDNGRLWVGTDQGADWIDTRFDRKEDARFHHFTVDKAWPANLDRVPFRKFYQDRKGMLWIISALNILRLDPANTGDSFKKFTLFSHNPENQSSIGAQIICMYQDRSGTMWFGTLFDGLYKLAGNDCSTVTPEDAAIVRYGTDDGLPSNQVNGILEDGKGDLWLSTLKGLSRFDPQKEVFRNYDPTDGLAGYEFNGTCIKTHDGKMYFGGVNGLTAFIPDRIRQNPYIPGIVLTSLSQGGAQIATETNIENLTALVLRWPKNFFEFEFAALNYSQPEKNQFAYFLEGFDDDWHSTGTRRFGQYTNLPGGDYTLRIKGSNNDGLWNETGISLAITIQPPFWYTWWFRIMIVLLISGIALAIFRGRLRRVRMQTELHAAHNAQMSIMPAADPQLEGFDISGVCIPANEVGGDFFDYIRPIEPDGYFYIMTGDVSGKAMASAMTAVMASGMIYSKAHECLPVDRMMTQLNQPLLEKTDKSMFTALCIAAIDKNNKQLSFVNAGLEHPLLKQGGRAEFVAGSGPKFPLGTVAGTVYQATTVDLSSGDLFIIYTDGVSESRNHAKEQYGVQRLKALVEDSDTDKLSAKEIKHLIVEDIRHFSHRTAQYDDIALVVIKVD